ncbi:hypothetical protein CNMCM5623_005567 [Aspergillus felis]|uniref:Short-chain dehydrogenase n=1 Tax=Aspergillus felis TaxID=1287682 RepID=A0A8H6PS29_9EURO|nr:hypothetical protein CNMCM5623_005567 [Aspergillus felis]
MGRHESSTFAIDEIPDLSGYVIIVTGGNQGVGYATTLHLAKRHARVYLAARSKTRAMQAIEEMKRVDSSIDVRFLLLDLQSMASVKEAAEQFMREETQLDILIHNAGIMAVPYQVTDDGYESQIQTNYLSPYAFTRAILPALERAAAAHPGDPNRVRVVNVSSSGHNFAPSIGIDFEDINMSSHTGEFAPWRRYGQFKLAMIHNAYSLNERYKIRGITAYSLNPGNIKTNLQQNAASISGTIIRGLTFISQFSLLSTDDGSRTSLFCATSPNAPQSAAKYHEPFGKVSKKKFDHKQAEKLWDWTESELARFNIF